MEQSSIVCIISRLSKLQNHTSTEIAAAFGTQREISVVNSITRQIFAMTNKLAAR